MTKSSIRRGIGLLLIGSLALSALAVHDGFILKRKAKVGDTEELTLTGTMDVGGGEAKLTGKESVKITAVKPDGSYTEQTDSHDFNFDLGGNSQAVPDRSETVAYGPDGTVLSIKDGDNDAGPEGYRLSNLTLFKATDKPLSVGDELKYNIAADKVKQTPGVSLDFKIVATEKVKDWDTLKMTFTSSETDGDSKASASGTVWVSTADGSLVKTDSKWVNVTMPGAPFPISGEFIVDRTK